MESVETKNPALIPIKESKTKRWNSRIGNIQSVSKKPFIANYTAGNNNVSLLDSYQIPKITLQISDGDRVRSTDIKYFGANVTTGLDPGYDAMRINVGDNSFAVYTHLVSDSDGTDFMLQALPDYNYESMVVPIGINADTGTVVTFTAEAFDLPSDIHVYLEDTTNQTITRLDEDGAEYTITLTSTLNGIGRFFLHTSTEAALHIDTFSLKNINIYKTNDSNLRIKGLQNGEASLKIFNILGKLVLQRSFIARDINDITLTNFKAGVYIIQLRNNGQKLNKKIVME